MRHFLEFSENSRDEVLAIIEDAMRFKREGYPTSALKNKVIALIFEKPSTRTRVSFESAIAKMGGSSIYLSTQDLQLARGEEIRDTARVMAKYVDAIVARLSSHSTIMELAEYSSVPVINALTDLHHPCQALADLMTMFEKSGRKSGFKLAYIGDGNNVCNSLVQATALMGIDMSVASPPGFSVRGDIAEVAMRWAERSGSKIVFTEDPEEAVRDADFVYTDVFVSMGREGEAEARRRIFLPKYQVNSKLMSLAKPGAKFMHCMPMRRGEEVVGEVADGPASIIIDQAENRIHTEAALLYRLLVLR